MINRVYFKPVNNLELSKYVIYQMTIKIINNIKDSK